MRRSTALSSAILAVSALAAAAVGKDDDSTARGLRLTVEAVPPEQMKEKPDPEKYRKVKATLGNWRHPMGQRLTCTFKLSDPKTGAESEPMPEAQWLALLKSETLLADLKDKDGDVVVAAGGYLAVCLPAMKSDDRKNAEKWKSLLDWSTLLITNQRVAGNAAGKFPHENVYRDVRRVKESDWAILMLDRSPVVYVEPLDAQSPESGKGGKSKGGKKAPPEADTGAQADEGAETSTDMGAEAEKKLTLWIWNPVRTADEPSTGK